MLPDCKWRLSFKKSKIIITRTSKWNYILHINWFHMLNHTCIFTFFSIELKKKQKHQLVEFYIFGLLTVPYAVSRCNWKYFHFLLLCIYIKMTTLNHMHLKVFFFTKGGGGWSPGQVVRVLVWVFLKSSLCQFYNYLYHCLKNVFSM